MTIIYLYNALNVVQFKFVIEFDVVLCNKSEIYLLRNKKILN